PGTYFLRSASWADLGHATSKFVPLANFGLGEAGHAQGFVVGDDRFFLEVLDPNSIAGYDPATSTVIDPTPKSRHPSEYPMPLDAGAIAFDLEAPLGIFFIADDGMYTRIVHTDAPWLPTAFAVDRSHADDLLWVESQGSPGFGYDSSAIFMS